MGKERDKEKDIYKEREVRASERETYIYREREERVSECVRGEEG